MSPGDKPYMNTLIKSSDTKEKKAKTPIFNFPLKQASRDKLEELSALANLTLAGVIRRSIDAAYDAAMTPKLTHQDNVTILETLLTMHNDLVVIKTSVASLLATQKNRCQKG